MIKLYNNDCRDVLRVMKPVKCIFADVPDNIKLKYDNYDDNLPLQNYYDFLELIILNSLKKCQIFWLSYNSIHDLEIKYIVRNILKHHKAFEASTFIWYYTFSQYNDKDCGHGYRPILRLIRIDAEIYPDSIREE